MAKITLDKDGKIRLPESYLKRHTLAPGTTLVFEPDEDGLKFHFVRPDVQRAYIEVTNRCNLNCAMCVRQSRRDPLGKMSPQTFQDILEGLRGFPDLNRVIFGGFGEPLMHPNIVEMVAQIRSLGVGVTITTNGLMLKRPLAEALLKAGADTIVVSLDSMHIQAYQQAKVNGGVNQVLENIQGVHELIQGSGWKLPALGLEYVVTQSNLEELYKLPDLAQDVAASFVIVTNLLPHTEDLVSETLYDRDEPLHLGGGWGIHRAGWIAWGVPRLPRMKWGSAQKCSFVDRSSLVIGWDGGVSPCYALMHSYTYYIYGRHKEVNRYMLGTVGERSLVDIWTSEEYVRFRANVRDFRFPSCVDCGMDCTYAKENSDCWGNDPSCADCLWAQGILQCP